MLMPPLQLLMLAMLNIAEEYVRQEKSLNRFGEFLEKKADFLKNVISGEK